jgi:hypothetical protein
MNKLSLLARIRRTGRAALLRGLAGVPAGIHARSRRGVVLILVIGALALISVITRPSARATTAIRRSWCIARA